jgi:hypothetical protein
MIDPNKLTDEDIDNLTKKVSDAVIDVLEANPYSPSEFDQAVAYDTARAFMKAVYLELFKAQRNAERAREQQGADDGR